MITVIYLLCHLTVKTTKNKNKKHANKPKTAKSGQFDPSQKTAKIRPIRPPAGLCRLLFSYFVLRVLIQIPPQKIPFSGSVLLPPWRLSGAQLSDGTQAHLAKTGPGGLGQCLSCSPLSSQKLVFYCVHYAATLLHYLVKKPYFCQHGAPSFRHWPSPPVQSPIGLIHTYDNSSKSQIRLYVNFV